MWSGLENCSELGWKIFCMELINFGTFKEESRIAWQENNFLNIRVHK